MSDCRRYAKTFIEIARPLESIAALFDVDAHRIHDQRRSFQRGPDFGVTSVNYDLAEPLRRSGAPG